MLDKADADLLFEASWEVCNKVGGIYTVVTSKATLTKAKYPRYILIGPYFEDKARAEFLHKPAPKDMQEVFTKLEASEGIKCHYGMWLLNDEQEVILIEAGRFFETRNKIKEGLWFDYRIDSLRSGYEFEEPIVWSTAVGMLIDEYAKQSNHMKIVGHFHEWMAGAAILYLKNRKSTVATVFTTHAIILGRSICGSNRDLYAELENLNPEKEAYTCNIPDKHMAERACAQNADVFTTVSEITAMEASKILGRKPDVLTLNGIDMSQFPTVEEFSIKHVTCREKLREVVISHFFPYYHFDINNVMFLFISGRYEFRNKGIDIFIKSLARLNEALAKEHEQKTIVVFFWIPQWTLGVKTEALENKNYYRHIKNYVSYNSEKILSAIVHDLVSQQGISKQHLFSPEFMQELRRDLITFKRKGLPQICTHNLGDEANDPIMKALKENNLTNKREDRVKVIFNPVYLEGSDGLVNLQYYDAIAGCHLGIFPSYYEPWGYTPLEAVSMGVPAITSDLAGFGRFVQAQQKLSDDSGVFLIERHGKNEEDAVAALTSDIYRFIKRDKHARARNKINAKEIADLADWQKLIANYISCHNLALKRKGAQISNENSP